MNECPICKLPLFGFVHSNGKEQGKICLKCNQTFDLEPFCVDTNIDYEEAILARQEDDFDDSYAWEDDSDRGCKDCPPDECTGHCMSCYYRPV